MNTLATPHIAKLRAAPKPRYRRDWPGDAFDRHDETALAAAMAEAAKAERAKATERDGEYFSRRPKTKTGWKPPGGNPRLSEIRKERANRQAQEAQHKMLRILRHGEWLDTPAVAARYGSRTNHVGKWLRRMAKDGLVEGRRVSKAGGGVKMIWRLTRREAAE